MSNWASLHTYSYYSLLHSNSNPIKIAERAVQAGLSAIALTDENGITGSVAFMKAFKDVCSCGHHKNLHSDTRCYGDNKKCQCKIPPKDIKPSNVKPILGAEFKIRNNDQSLSKITVIAKNYDGWRKLISLTSEANKEENIIRDTPSLSFNRLATFCDGNIIGISGYDNSEIADTLFDSPEMLYFIDSYASGRKLSSLDNFNKSVKLAGKYEDAFGRGNFYLATQDLDKDSGFSQLLSKAMRSISKKTGIPCVADNSSNYSFPEDFDDQRLLICSNLDSNFDNVDSKFSRRENAWLKKFFNSQKYYIPSPAEMIDAHPEDEIKTSLEIAEKCEVYNILNKPSLPVFDCPNNKTPDQYLKELCVKGWKEKIDSRIQEDKIPQYKSQIRNELEVIQNAGLSSYFLIVEDYCREARKQGQLLGNGRGSAAGSLISYLANITKTDPVKYGLMFERFYNAGRNTADRTSLPDIDTDFEDRDSIIEYISNKYGKNRVGQMITFSRILGKGSLREVFRVKFPSIPLSEVDKITEALPAESEINDKLQEMKESGEEASIIMWALEANAKKLKPYCYIDEQGRLQGEYASAFKQAIRLEGTKKSPSKHPSGIVISNNPLADIVPMVYDKTSKKAIAGLEMNDLEDMGICKFDILQIDVLRKLHGVSKLLATGRID